MDNTAGITADVFADAAVGDEFTIRDLAEENALVIFWAREFEEQVPQTVGDPRDVVWADVAVVPERRGQKLRAQRLRPVGASQVLKALLPHVGSDRPVLVRLEARTTRSGFQVIIPKAARPEDKALAAEVLEAARAHVAQLPEREDRAQLEGGVVDGTVVEDGNAPF
jgi:hypothetical protein